MVHNWSLRPLCTPRRWLITIYGEETVAAPPDYRWKCQLPIQANVLVGLERVNLIT